jgi:septal ring factor EnvC (AmiA/AmiB activator)
VRAPFPIAAYCVFLMSFSAIAGASEEGSGIAKKLRENREVINESEAEKRRLLGSLYAINQRMKKISSRKGKLTDELLQSQDAVATVAVAIKTLEDQIARQRSSLKIRLRALYKISGESYFGAVFSTSNAFEFDSTLRNLKIISDRDFHLIRAYRSNLTLLGQQRKKLRGQVEKLLLVEKRIQKQEGLLAQEHQAKSMLANRIDGETRKRISEIRRLRQTVNVSDVEIAQLLKPSIYEKKGTLLAPVGSGQIAREFGLHVDEKHQFKISHKGWLIDVGIDTPVVSTDDGTVVFQGALTGYGNALIVDHDDHYYSIYAGLAKVETETGARVLRGQKLAASSGQLYFEFRHFSEPENPAHWISRQSAIQTGQMSKNLERKLAAQSEDAQQGDAKW